LGGIRTFHIFDYEGNGKDRVAAFEKILKRIKDAKKLKSKIKYEIGYSNQSFDLWIIMHKEKLTRSITKSSDYLKYINKVYGTDFESFDKYKQECNFKKKILSKVSLKDVFKAIEFAKEIRENNEKNSKDTKEFDSFKYYPDNPDLTVHECVEKMLPECGVSKDNQ